MPGIFGILGIDDADRSFINTLGQRTVFDAAQQLFAQWNIGLAQAMATFVERTEESHKFRYYLPGTGRMQRRGNQSVSGATKAAGSWDVALPLEDFGAQLAGDDVGLAYMDIQQFNRHLQTIFNQDRATVRFEMLKAIFNNTARTFVDPIHGSLTVQPLAIGATDGVVYPPVEGSETEATDDHYLESGYASGSISTSNNPIVTIRDELEEHFGGGTTGGSNIVIFCNNAQTAILTGLASFDDVKAQHVTEGQDTAVADAGLPAGIPGKLLGYGYGAWLVEWRWVPANYMLGIHLDAPRPLLQRIDPAYTNLGSGLQLVSEDDTYPFRQSHYRHRYGFGVGNRLNGVVMELGTGGSYSIPAAYV